MVACWIHLQIIFNTFSLMRQANIGIRSLIPIAVGRLNKGVSTIVLSGDPKQLEASVRSPVGAGFRFGKSLQERLMAMPLYNPVNFQDSQFCFIQLNQNYRSHECILNFSSNQFYGGTLKACVDQNKANRFLEWQDLPVKQSCQRILFH